MSQFSDLLCQLISCLSFYIRSNLPLLDICAVDPAMGLFNLFATDRFLYGTYIVYIAIGPILSKG